MDKNLIRFAALDFVDDDKVRGYHYWYICEFDAEKGDKAVAPLGRHNNLQTGIVKEIRYADEFEAPFPVQNS